MKVAVLGYGQLGRALASALAAAGGHTVSVWTRSPVDAGARPAGVTFFAGDDPGPAVRDAEVVWLAVTDRAVADLAARLAGLPRDWAESAAIHSSGALSVGVLEPLAARGAATAACHPLRAFPRTAASGSREAGARNPFAGAPFTLEGAPRGVEAARRLVAALGGVALASRVRDRALYHLAAVVASNYGLLVRDWSARRFETAGLSAADAGRAADALLSNALESARVTGGDLPLSGPVKRGDVETVRAHLSRLAGHERLAYAALGLFLLEAVGRETRPAGATAGGDAAWERLAELFRHALEEILALEPAARSLGR